MLIGIFKAYGLFEQGKTRSLEISVTFDAAKLNNLELHVMCGVKMNDAGALDPITGDLLLLNTDEGCVQSRELCFPLYMIIGCESIATLVGFRHMFDFFPTIDDYRWICAPRPQEVDCQLPS